MARKTRLELVNAVLRRLRQQTVAAVSATDYSTLIGEFVDQAVSDVEAAWRWVELRQELDITTTAGDDTYTLSDFGEAYRIEEIYDATARHLILAAPDWRFEYRQNMETATTGPPEWWRIYGTTNTGDPQLQLYPAPGGAYSIVVYAVVGQHYLTADADVLLVPSKPVILRAHALAVSERGEDGGMGFSELDAFYQQAIQDAMAQDNMNVAAGTNSDWRLE